jgi:hypothetical protein
MNTIAIFHYSQFTPKKVVASEVRMAVTGVAEYKKPTSAVVIFIVSSTGEKEGSE